VLGAALITLGLASLNSHATAEQPLGCLIQPSQVAELGSPVIGVLRDVRVDRGDVVRGGQVLAVLRTEVEKASLDVARARSESESAIRASEADWEYNRLRLERAEELRRQNFISAQALEQARAEADMARQRLEQSKEQRRVWEREQALAEAQLNQRVIRSPFSGVVLERYQNPGERVEEKPILKLANMNPLRVEVFMPVSRFGSIRPGTMLDVLPELPGAEARRAKVTRVDRIIDPASNTFRVQLQLPNPRLALPAGLRCKIQTDMAEPAAPPAKRR